MNLQDYYAKYISIHMKNYVQESYGEGEKSNITSHVEKKYGGRGGPGGSGALHVGSHGNHHAYNIETEDFHDTHNSYAIHNEKTGQTHEVKLPGKVQTAAQVHKHIKPHGGSSTLAKHIANDHNSMHENYNSYMDELDNILSEMSDESLIKLAEGPFSPVGKFMMKRKLAKGISKNREKQQANKDYASSPYVGYKARNSARRKSDDAGKMATRQTKALTRLNRPESYSEYISNQMKNYVNEELIHGISHEGASIHLNRSKTDRDRNGNSHYAIKHKDGSTKHFSVSDSKAGEDNGHEHIAAKAGLSSNHPFVKTIHKSHTGDHGPEAWQE